MHSQADRRTRKHNCMMALNPLIMQAARSFHRITDPHRHISIYSTGPHLHAGMELHLGRNRTPCMHTCPSDIRTCNWSDWNGTFVSVSMHPSFLQSQVHSRKAALAKIAFAHKQQLNMPKLVVYLHCSQNSWAPTQSTAACAHAKHMPIDLKTHTAGRDLSCDSTTTVTCQAVLHGYIICSHANTLHR